MLSWLWFIITAISTIYIIITGNSSEYTAVLYGGTEDAVELCITLAGIMALWGGLMEIAEKSGVTDVFSKVLSPIINLIFPDIKHNQTCKKAVSMNITANILGLGNAATPLGITAMKELWNFGGRTHEATDSMVTFVVINTASVQLIPVTTAALRAKYGSLSPMSILPAVLATSFAALMVGLIAERLMRKPKGII